MFCLNVVVQVTELSGKLFRKKIQVTKEYLCWLVFVKGSVLVKVVVSRMMLKAEGLGDGR